MREMRISLDARLSAMEANQRKGVVIGDMSDQEEVADEEPQEERDLDDLRMERLLKVVKGEGTKVKMKIPVYAGTLNGEEILDCIGELDKYFEFEEAP